MKTEFIATLAAAAGVYAQNAVPALGFNGLPAQITYKKVVATSNYLTCSYQDYTTPKSDAAPLAEEFGFAFRGPLNLAQFAVYQPSSSSSKREVSPRAARSSPHARRNAHQAIHDKHKREAAEKRAEHEKRACGAEIVATYPGGGLMTFTDTWDCAATPAAAAAAAPAAANEIGNVALQQTAAAAESTAAAKASSSSSASSASVPAGSYGRSAYYDAASQTSTGLTFLGADYSLPGYLPSSGIASNGLASSPQILAQTLVPDAAEFQILSSTPCSGGSCGVTNGGPASFHGWAGEKVVLFEFSMPTSGTVNRPAIWSLNAQAFNTYQYGCNCINNAYTQAFPGLGGCGEFDIAEAVIGENNPNQLTSSLHMGDTYAVSHPDYIARPTGATMKLAAIFGGANTQVVTLPNDFIFPETLSSAAYQTIVAGGAATSGSALEKVESLLSSIAAPVIVGVNHNVF